MEAGWFCDESRDYGGLGGLKGCRDYINWLYRYYWGWQVTLGIVGHIRGT